MIKAKYSAAITDKPWWLAGGIPRDACVAAYQAVGATDIEPSKINLTGNAIYNAIEGANPPITSAAGWTFVYAAADYLKTGVVPLDKYSMIVRYSNWTETSGFSVAGSLKNTPNNCFFEINPVNALTGNMRFLYGDQVATVTDGAKTGGVIALTSEAGYYNGMSVVTIPAYTWNGTTFDVYIGTRNLVGSPSTYITTNIQAVAIYKTTVTPNQIAALTNAMNAL